MDRIPEITVLMPVHNGEPHVREAAASILNQTFRDFEFLVVDDASDDRTVEILESFGDPRLRLLKSRERLRFSGALNFGLEHARGALIARMDADDIALPDRLACQRAFMQAHPDIGLSGGLATAFGLRRGAYFRPPMTHAEIQAYLLFDSPFVHPTVMMRRELLEQHGLRFDPAFCPADDYELWSRATRLFPVANLDRVVLRYRVHGASLTGTEWGSMDACAARVAGRELQALGLAGDDEALRFHRNLGRGGCFPIGDAATLARAETWLQKLLAANDRAGRYDREALRRIVAGIWYSACYHAGPVGREMLRRYAGSSLRRGRATSVREWAALFHVALRSGAGKGAAP